MILDVIRCVYLDVDSSSIVLDDACIFKPTTRFLTCQLYYILLQYYMLLQNIIQYYNEQLTNQVVIVYDFRNS